MSLSNSRTYPHSEFVEVKLFNSQGKYVVKKNIDLRIDFKRIVALKTSYSWNNSKPRRLTPNAIILINDKNCYFFAIRIPDKIGKNTLTIIIEWDGDDGKIQKNSFCFDITIER